VFSLLASMGSGGFKLEVLAPMLLGGVIAAPVAAWMIRHVPARLMGVAVAGLLLTTNAKDIAAFAGVGKSQSLWLVYAAIVVLMAAALMAARWLTPEPAPTVDSTPSASA
jgi:mannitol-specific phosphotransferase system IIBC component